MATGRQRYREHAVETASPATRLIMVIDQLDVEITRAQKGFDANDLYEVHCGLRNAQAIVALMRDSLDVSVWEGAHDVRRIYQFAIGLLLRANLEKNRSHCDEAVEVLSPLMDAWREAARLVETGNELAYVSN